MNYYELAKTLPGRCIFRDGVNYTVVGCSSIPQRVWAIKVFNPATEEYLIFDSLETFNNWAYGAPVSAGVPREAPPR